MIVVSVAKLVSLALAQPHIAPAVTLQVVCPIFREVHASPLATMAIFQLAMCAQPVQTLAKRVLFPKQSAPVAKLGISTEQAVSPLVLQTRSSKGLHALLVTLSASNVILMIGRSVTHAIADTIFTTTRV